MTAPGDDRALRAPAASGRCGCAVQEPATGAAAGRAGRERAQMLDRCAADAYRAGHHSQALRLLGLARAADPSLAPRLNGHQAQASAARLAAEAQAGPRPLVELVAGRMAEAGIRPDDPALAVIAEHNTRAWARAGSCPAPAPQPDPGREWFRRQVLAAAAGLEAGP